jgi:hypothetical protein
MRVHFRIFWKSLARAARGSNPTENAEKMGVW